MLDHFTHTLIDRRNFVSLGLAAGATALTASPLLAAEQNRPFRILMFTYRGETAVERGFRDYFAANNVKAEFLARDVERDVSRVKGMLAADLPRFKPDLIYTYGTSLTLAVAGRYDSPPAGFIRDIPVTFALVAAPVQVKIAPSMQSSGRNVTGAVHVVPTDVQMRAMQAYRAFRKVGVIYSPNAQNSVAIVEQMRSYCKLHGFELLEMPLKMAGRRPTAEGVEDMVKQLKVKGAGWLYLPPDSFLASIYSRVANTALDVGLPTFGSTEYFLRAGPGLFGLVSRYYSVGQLAASKSVEILVQKTLPKDIEIETLKRFSLIVNMKVAKKLGIYPPISMLNYAEVLT